MGLFDLCISRYSGNDTRHLVQKSQISASPSYIKTLSPYERQSFTDKYSVQQVVDHAVCTERAERKKENTPVERSMDTTKLESTKLVRENNI